jgi:polysaccharide export outer membrane protein
VPMNVARVLVLLMLIGAVPEARAQRNADRREASPAAATIPLAPPAVTAPAVEPYRIGPEDLLDISVWNNDALSRIVPVRPDGKISMPLVPDVQAAGLTPVELRDSLRASLAAYITSSEVSVVVREVHSFKVSVLGEVKSPGRYELKSRATILDAVALAGGFNDFAARGRILIIRQAGGVTNRIVFNYTKFVTRDNQGDCPALLPGDLVIVP